MVQSSYELIYSGILTNACRCLSYARKLDKDSFLVVFHSFAQTLEELVNVVRKIRVDTESTVMLGYTAAVVR